MAEGFAGGVSAMLTAATNLNNAIGQGFSVDYEGAQQLSNFVSGMQHSARTVLNKSDRMAQTPKLGTTPAANVYKPYLPTIATDNDQGLLPNVEKLRDQLDSAASNIQRSIAAYEGADAASRGALVHIQNVEAV
jgi:hypothetical protein